MIGLALLLICVGGADRPADVDLAFRTPSLIGWEGNGFEVRTEDGKATGSTAMRASSQNAPKDGRALFHAAVPIPPGTKEIHCFAAAIRAKPGKPSEDLDVLMYAAGKHLIPKRVRVDQGWQPVDHLLAPRKISSKNIAGTWKPLPAKRFASLFWTTIHDRAASSSAAAFSC